MHRIAQFLREHIIEQLANPAEVRTWLDLWKAGRLGLEDLVPANDDGGEAALFRALVYLKQDNISDAARAAQACLALGAPMAPLAHHILGLIEKQKHTSTANAAARDHFFETAKAFPDWAANLTLLGEHAYCTDALDVAISALARATQMEPEDTHADYFYVNALVAAGDFDTLKTYAASRKALHPDVEQDVRALQCEKTDTARPVRLARYPSHKDLTEHFWDTVRKTVMADLQPITPFITKQTKIFTLGSCFAGNVARVLKADGYMCNHLFLGETINTTFANRRIVAWLLGKADEDEAKMNSFLANDLNAAQARAAISEADALVYTLGVAPCFFDRETGAFVLPKASELNARNLAARYVYRTTSVQENEENLSAILAMIREVNPKIKIFVSVSPVPMRATFERKASVLADCVSKSVLRVAAENVTAGRGGEDLFYWPTFEIFRWLSGHVGPFYGVDDGSSVHVSEKIVEESVRLFLELYRK